MLGVVNERCGLMNSEQLRAIIKNVSFFKGLSESDVAKIFSKGMTVRVTKDEVLFYKNTVGNQMYVVLAEQTGRV